MAPRRATVCRICGAPRYERCEYALCEACFHQQARVNKVACRARLTQSHAPDARRLQGWLDTAHCLGANEDEAWRVAVALSRAWDAGEYKPGRWAQQRIAAELDYLRETAAVRARLDAWQPVAGMVNTEWQPPAEDWELEEAV